MTHDELIAANEALLARRKRETASQPKTIDTLAQTVATQNGMTIDDYFSALRSGLLPTSPDAESVNTSRVRWESFESDRHPALVSGIKAIKSWYSDRIDRGGSIILAGNFGCGKTHLAKAIYDLYGYGAIYWNELKLVGKIQAGYGGQGGRSLESIAVECRRAKLLIYDDLGAYETDNLKWMQNIYLSLLDGRHDEGKALLVTTNLKLIQADSEDDIWSPLENRLGGRVYSRLMGSVEDMIYYVDLFDVPDYRLRNF